MPLEKLLHLLGPLVLAFFVAREFWPDCKTRNNTHKIAKVFEKIAGCILPLLILSVVRRTEITNELWIIVAAGFFLPILYFIILPLITSILRGPDLSGSDNIVARMLFSSFGGGNRGNLILIILISSNVIPAEATSYYVALDFGNLLCVITIGFYLVQKSIIPKQPKNNRLSDILNKVKRAPGFYAVLVAMLQMPMLRSSGIGDLFTMLDPLIKISGDILFPFFSFCVFVGLFIRAEHLGVLLKKAPSIIILSFVSRAIPAFLLIILSKYLNNNFLIPCAVLIMMPPSSYLWTKITETHKYCHDFEGTYIVPNVLYFFLLGATYVYALMKVSLR